MLKGGIYITAAVFLFIGFLYMFRSEERRVGKEC